MQKLCGIDEAGRGCVAGDLVVAGVVFEQPNTIEGLDDSKKLSASKRQKLYEQITTNANYHIVTISSEQIDEIGISKAMQNALTQIQNNLQATTYLFDGNTTFGVKNLQVQVKADKDVLEVSAASILAKVTHDNNILKAAQEFPHYQFEKNKGYATKQHIEAIKKYGYSKYHRKSYQIKQLEPTLFDF